MRPELRELFQVVPRTLGFVLIAAENLSATMRLLEAKAKALPANGNGEAPEKKPAQKAERAGAAASPSSHLGI